MSDVLTRDPLLTTLSMVDGHHVEPQQPADERHQPLAYLYSEWDGTLAAPQPGDYDEKSQTWSFPDGMPTAGIATYTNTSCYMGSDRCRDDTCA